MELKDYIVEIEDYDLEYYRNSCGMTEQEIGAYHLFCRYRDIEKVAEIMGIEIDEADKLSDSAYEKIANAPGQTYMDDGF